MGSYLDDNALNKEVKFTPQGCSIRRGQGAAPRPTLRRSRHFLKFTYEKWIIMHPPPHFLGPCKNIEVKIKKWTVKLKLQVRNTTFFFPPHGFEFSRFWEVCNIFFFACQEFWDESAPSPTFKNDATRLHWDESGILARYLSSVLKDEFW